jgi:hypothetical protein
VLAHHSLALGGGFGFEGRDEGFVTTHRLGSSAACLELLRTMQATEPKRQLMAYRAPQFQEAPISRGLQDDLVEIKIQLGDLEQGGRFAGGPDIRL